MKILLSLLFLMTAGISFSQEVVYTYLDGSGNMYEIYETKVKYKPVKKENSSSGEYSGGTAKEVVITSKQFKNIKDLAKNSIGAKSEQTANREMGTGMIIWMKGDEEKMIILKMDSESRKKFEAELKSVLGI